MKMKTKYQKHWPSIMGLGLVPAEGWAWEFCPLYWKGNRVKSKGEQKWA